MSFGKWLKRKVFAWLCDPYEKFWEGMCVDAELRESWLSRMNAIHGIWITYTCAGHREKLKSHPGIPDEMRTHPLVAFWPGFHPGANASDEKYDLTFGAGFKAVESETESEETLDALVANAFKGLADVGPSRTRSGHRFYFVRAPVPRAEMSEKNFSAWWSDVIDVLEHLPHMQEREGYLGSRKSGEVMPLKHMGSIWDTVLGREPCLEYEKRWRDLCVDKDLKNKWIERLNSIEGIWINFSCAGHIEITTPGQSDRPTLSFWPHFHDAAYYSPLGYQFYGAYRGMDPAPMNEAEAELDEYMKKVFEGLADVREARTLSGHRTYTLDAPIPRSEMTEAEFVAWWEDVVDRLEWFSKPKSKRGRLAGIGR